MKKKEKRIILLMVGIGLIVGLIIISLFALQIIRFKCNEIRKGLEFDCEMKCELNQMKLKSYSGTCQKVDCYCVDKNGKTVKEVIEYFT